MLDTEAKRGWRARVPHMPHTRGFSLATAVVAAALAMAVAAGALADDGGAAPAAPITVVKQRSGSIPFNQDVVTDVVVTGDVGPGAAAVSNIVAQAISDAIEGLNTNFLATVEYVDETVEEKVGQLDDDISGRGYLTEADFSQYVRFDDITQTNSLTVGDTHMKKATVTDGLEVTGGLVLTSDTGEKYRFGVDSEGRFYFTRVQPAP